MDYLLFLSYLMKYDKYADFIEHSGVDGMSWYHHDENRRQQGEKAYAHGKDTEGFVIKSPESYGKNKKKSEEDQENEEESVEGIEDILNTAKDKTKKAVDAVSKKEAARRKKKKRKKDLKESDKDREIDEETGLYLKKFDFTENEDMALVNPNLKYSKKLGIHFGDDEYAMNCVSCSIAYEMRRRGYDVESVPSKEARGRLATEYENAFHNTERGTLYNMDINSEYNKYSSRNQTTEDYYRYAISRNDAPGTEDSWIDRSLDTLRKQGEGASGILSIRMWQGGGGHALHYTIKNGDVVITDAQINERYTDPVAYLSNKAFSATYFRLDNATINPEGITNFVRNRN